MKRGAWVGSWGGVILAVLAGILAACDGGQTGDVGTGDGSCHEVSRTPLDAAGAEAAGYPGSLVIARMLSGRDLPQPVWAALAPSLWSARGESPPADRSAAGLLSVQVGDNLVEVRRACEPSITDYPYARTLEVPVSYRLEIPELASEQWGEGKIELVPGAAPERVEGGVSSDGGVAVADDCILREATSNLNVLACDSGGLAATGECLDATGFAAADPVPRSALTLTALMDTLAAQSPVVLTCDTGETVEAAFAVLAPDRYCRSMWPANVAPAVLSLSAPAIGLPLDASYAAGIKVSEQPRCGIDCRDSSQCVRNAGGGCTVLHIGATQLPKDFRLATDVAVYDDGGITLWLDATVPDAHGFHSCAGRVDLASVLDKLN